MREKIKRGKKIRNEETPTVYYYAVRYEWVFRIYGAMVRLLARHLRSENTDCERNECNVNNYKQDSNFPHHS